MMEYQYSKFYCDFAASKGCLHAAHFCYLVAQLIFGVCSKLSSKIVLLGSSNSLPFELFASNEAVQCTEVYEYTQSLGMIGFCLPTFQLYKYLYAVKLADHGLTEEVSICAHSLKL